MLVVDELWSVVRGGGGGGGGGGLTADGRDPFGRGGGILIGCVGTGAGTVPVVCAGWLGADLNLFIIGIQTSNGLPKRSY